MSNSTLSPKAAYTATTITALKRIEYRLPVVEMTPKQCDSITKRIYKWSQPKMRVNSKLPLAYRHGLGLPDVRLLQFSCHLKEIMLHTYRKSLNSTIFHTYLESVHLHLGMGVPCGDIHMRTCIFLSRNVKRNICGENPATSKYDLREIINDRNIIGTTIVF